MLNDHIQYLFKNIIIILFVSLNHQQNKRLSLNIVRSILLWLKLDGFYYIILENPIILFSTDFIVQFSGFFLCIFNFIFYYIKFTAQHTQYNCVLKIIQRFFGYIIIILSIYQILDVQEIYWFYYDFFLSFTVVLMYSFFVSLINMWTINLVPVININDNF